MNLKTKVFSVLPLALMILPFPVPNSTPSCQETLSKTHQFYSSSEPQKLHDANAPPVDVYLVPGKSMARRGWMRMMIIVPAFAKRQQRDPPVVS